MGAGFSGGQRFLEAWAHRGSLSPVPGGEGWGEGGNVRQSSQPLSRDELLRNTFGVTPCALRLCARLARTKALLA